MLVVPLWSLLGKCILVAHYMHFVEIHISFPIHPLPNCAHQKNDTLVLQSRRVQQLSAALVFLIL